MMRTLLAGLVLIAVLALCVAAFAADSIVIEDMNYRSNEDARSKWIPVDNSEPVYTSSERTPNKMPALAMPFDLNKLKERAYWDRKLDLDLTSHSTISFWVKGEGDTSGIGNCSFFLQSENGWYGTSFAIEPGSWKKVTLNRSDFISEGQPTGWSKITGMRVAFWKLLGSKGVVHIGPISAMSSDVVVVRNSRAGKETGNYAELASAALAGAGIEAVTIDDADVEKGALKGKAIAVYPYSSEVSAKEDRALQEFVDSGGKLVVFFSVTPTINKLLGMTNVQYVAPAYKGQFASMVADKAAQKTIPGMPNKLVQGSWNILKPVLEPGNASVLYEWYDSAGKPTGMPAIVGNKNGMFVSHIMLADDPLAWRQLLRAMLGKLDKSLWKRVTNNAAALADTSIPQYLDFQSAFSAMSSEAKKTKNSKALASLEAAAKAHKSALSLAKSNKYPEALAQIDTQSKSMMQAYAMVQKTRPGEFRAIWCHSAYGVNGMTWDQAVQNLKVNGFTAIMPNMLWAGLASYNSEVLPVDPLVAEHGDQIQECLRACRKYGIKIHVWKVHWNLGNAPKEFVDRMIAEGRTQVDSSGKSEPWLCPSHPDNQQLELDSMLEIVRNYDVDGIHYDYIRYPDADHCYCEGCRQRFQSATGLQIESWPKDVLSEGNYYQQYLQFRRDNITNLVRAIHDKAKQIKPGIELSAAVFSNWPGCRDWVGQDWGAWIKQGYLDFVCPMDYTDSANTFSNTVKMQKKEVAGKIPLYPGIGASAPGLTSVQVMEQIKIVREQNLPGFIIFNYDSSTADTLIPNLGLGMTKAK